MSRVNLLFKLNKYHQNYWSNEIWRKCGKKYHISDVCHKIFEDYEKNNQSWQTWRKSGIRSGNLIDFRKRKSSFGMFIFRSLKKFDQNWLNLKIWIKSGKIGKIQKPDKYPEKKIIISYLRSKLIILWRNMVKHAEIWRFENCPDKSEKKKNCKWRFSLPKLCF